MNNEDWQDLPVGYRDCDILETKAEIARLKADLAEAVDLIWSARDSGGEPSPMTESLFCKLNGFLNKHGEKS